MSIKLENQKIAFVKFINRVGITWLNWTKASSQVSSEGWDVCVTFF